MLLTNLLCIVPIAYRDDTARSYHDNCGRMQSHNTDHNDNNDRNNDDTKKTKKGCENALK